VHEFSIAQLRHEMDKETAVAAELIGPALAESGDGAEIDAAVRRAGALMQARVTLVARDGTVIADSVADTDTMENHRDRPEIQAAFRAGVGTSIRESSTLDEPYLYAARALDSGSAVVRVAVAVDTADELVWGIQRQVMAAALVAAILMTGAGWFVARRIGAGLDALRAQATAVAAGRLDVSVQPAATRELGDLGRAFNVMTDQLRTTLAELERTRARLEATLAHLSDGVVITDAAGHVVRANDAARRMLAVSGPIAGESFVAVSRDHELTSMVTEALHEPAQPAHRTVRHGRSGRLLEAAAARIDAAEERIGLVVLRDVTELRRLEEVRRDFVANVSHELRTPLTSIRALVETLEAGAIDDAAVSSDFLVRIIAEVDRLTLLVNDLLDLARLESGRDRLAREEVAAEAIIERSVRSIAPQSGRAQLTVEIDVAPGTPALSVDRDRIDQVLLNLLDNAVKFSPAGATIVVSARRQGDVVEFRVRDTGIGISADDLPRLFERFYKVDRARGNQGTGLGLAIAKHIVQAHGGRIWAEPNTPRGAVFAFTVPIAKSVDTASPGGG
jgi:two-component system phosphate regulon sensor histidine kinase PhoR